MKNNMKHIKLFESFEDIESICRKYGITNYTINSDESIDVDGNVNLYEKGLTKLPLKFGNVTGHFNCSNNKLTTLEGSPKEVGGGFYCEYNQLTSLKGGPSKLGGDFYCSDDKLPKLILDNMKHIKKIVEYQEDYLIWRSNGSLDEYKFNDMMEEINDEI